MEGFRALGVFFLLAEEEEAEENVGMEEGSGMGLGMAEEGSGKKGNDLIMRREKYRENDFNGVEFDYH